MSIEESIVTFTALRSSSFRMVNNSQIDFHTWLLESARYKFPYNSRDNKLARALIFLTLFDQKMKNQRGLDMISSIG